MHVCLGTPLVALIYIHCVHIVYDIMAKIFFIVAVHPVHIINVTNQTAYDNFAGLSSLRTRSFRYLLILPVNFQSPMLLTVEIYFFFYFKGRFID